MGKLKQFMGDAGRHFLNLRSGNATDVFSFMGAAVGVIATALTVNAITPEQVQVLQDATPEQIMVALEQLESVADQVGIDARALARAKEVLAEYANVTAEFVVQRAGSVAQRALVALGLVGGSIVVGRGTGAVIDASVDRKS